MTIVIGTAQVNSSGKVELLAPMGFATARGLRLANYSTGALVLSNINGLDQSQQYLAASQQMVYTSVNAGVTPTVTALALPAIQVAANLLVEWSTDPINDFIGTYPVGLPQQITSTNGTAVVTTDTTSGTSGSADLGTVGSPQALIVASVSTSSAPGPGSAVAFYVSDGAAQVTAYLDLVAQTPSGQVLSIPFAPSHIEDIFVEWQAYGPSNVTGASFTVYALNNTNGYGIPQIYGTADYVEYIGTAPTGSSDVTLSGPISPAFFAQLGDCDIYLTIVPSITTADIEGFVDIAFIGGGGSGTSIISTGDLTKFADGSLRGRVRVSSTIFGAHDQSVSSFPMVLTKDTDTGDTVITLGISQVHPVAAVAFPGLIL